MYRYDVFKCSNNLNSNKDKVNNRIYVNLTTFHSSLDIICSWENTQFKAKAIRELFLIKMNPHVILDLHWIITSHMKLSMKVQTLRL